jgi:molybdate transport system ATP-binding protein
VKPLSFWCRHRFPSGVELDVRFETAAAVTAIVGPSGAGKTSVLYAIAGLLRPREGEIRFGERVFFSSQQRIHVAPQHRRVALVFQDYLLFPHLSVEQNLRYGQARRDKAGIEFARVVNVLELGSLLQRPPRNLSGGEKQRVALGRALLSGPELLLMDEPVTALDEPLKWRILDHLQDVVREWHVPAIYVSHSMADVQKMADHVVIIESGKCYVSAPIDQAFRPPPESQ